MKNLFLSITTFLAGVLLGTLILGYSSASVGNCHWQWHGWVLKWDCDGAPNPSPTPSPSASPSPTPTASPSASPSASPCVVWKGEFEEPCSSPEPSVSPSVTPCSENCGTTPTFPHDQGVSINECHTNPPKAAIATGGIQLDSDSATFQWIPTTDGNIKDQILKYGPSQDQLIYGVPSIPAEAHEITVNGLGKSWWFQIGTQTNDYCVSWSNIIDP